MTNSIEAPATPPIDAAFLKLLDGLSRLAKRMPARNRVRHVAASGIALDQRPYAQGDPIAHIDWHAYLRHHQLVTKTFEQQEPHNLMILLDQSASIGAGPGGERRQRGLVQTAAALAVVAEARHHDFGLVIFAGTEVRLRLPCGRGKAHTHRLLEALNHTRSTGGSGTTPELGRALGNLSHSTRALLLSDGLWPEPVAQPFRDLATRRVRTLMLCTPQPAPPPRGTVQLQDAETGQGLDLRVERNLAAAYRSATERHLRALTAACHANGGLLLPIHHRRTALDWAAELLRGGLLG